MKIRSYIIALDVGFRHTGVAIWSSTREKLVQTYVISTENSAKLKFVAENNVRALRHLVSRLRSIIEERPPIFIIAEMPVGSSRNARAAYCMALAFGAVVSLCTALDVPLKMVSPFEVKKLVDPGAGRKAVPKEKVIAYVEKHYGSSLLPDNMKKEHVADAIAARDAFFYLQRRGKQT